MKGHQNSYYLDYRYTIAENSIRFEAFYYLSAFIESWLLEAKN